LMRFAADENFDGDMLKGIKRRLPDLDIVRVQDTEMYQADDPALLAWLDAENRILITHDVNTMPGFLYERIRAGSSSPGIIIVKRSTPIGQAVDDLELMIGASEPEHFANQVRYIPLP